MALKLRRGTNAGRTAITPAEGEPIYTTDTKQLFIGDGTTAGGVAVGGGVSDGDKGDITVSGGGTVWTIDAGAVVEADIANNAVTNTKIANDAVTYAKIQNVSAASRLLGRGSASGAGDVEEITIGSGLSLTGTTLSTSGGGGGLVNFAETYNLDTARIQPNGAAADIGIVIAPKGNGAIQSALRTDSSVGGNMRGANAIDFQILRSAATQIAAASRSVIIGGVYGTITAGATDAGMFCSGNGSTINAISNNSVIVGGSTQSMQNSFSAIVGGNENIVSGNKAGIFAADGGLATAYNSVILGSSYSTVSGASSAIVGGASNVVGASESVSLGGANNNASKQGSVVMGTGSTSAHSEYSLCLGGTYTQGRSLTTFVTLNRQTTDSSTVFKLINGAGNQPSIQNNEAIGVKAVVVAKEMGGGTTHYGMWEVDALVTRFGSTSVIQYSNVLTKITSSGIMDVGFSINQSPSELNITFTGRSNMQVTATMQLTIVNRA